MNYKSIIKAFLGLVDHKKEEKNKESLLLIANYTKYSRKTHPQTFSRTQTSFTIGNTSSRVKISSSISSLSNSKNQRNTNKQTDLQ